MITLCTFYGASRSWRGEGVVLERRLILLACEGRVRGVADPLLDGEGRLELLAPVVVRGRAQGRVAQDKDGVAAQDKVGRGRGVGRRGTVAVVTQGPQRRTRRRRRWRTHVLGSRSSFKHNNNQLLHHLEPVGCSMLYSGVSLPTKPANFLLPIWKQTTFSDCGIKSARVFHETLPSSFTA